MRNKAAIQIYFQLPLFCLIGLLYYNGIGRGDVSSKKYREFSKDSVFECVGEVYNSKGNFLLSCVLLNSRYVISSAHGFYHESKEEISDSIVVLGQKKYIKRPKDARLFEPREVIIRFGKQYIPVKRIIVHPEYKDDFHSEGFFDIVLIELSEAVVNITPAKLFTASTELGSRGIICGFGLVSKASDDRFSLPIHRKMAGENMIDSLGGNKIDVNDGFLFADMDHPKFAICNRIGDSTPLPLEWHGSAGDCGGGLFIQQENQWRLAGVSFAPSYFEDWIKYGDKFGNYGFIDAWIRVSPIVPWVMDVIGK